MTNKTRQIIVVVAVFAIALASLGTVIGLLVNTGQMSEYSNGFRYELNGSRATIVGYEGSDTDVVVPDKVKGNRVVGIEKDAFKDLAGSIKSIKFNCTYSSFAFASEAFKDMTALEKVVLPANLKEISDGVFRGCTSLKNVIMPNSVTLIGENAFKGCTSLKFMYNSENYTTEGDGAIKSDAMYFPQSLLEIGANAFDGCTAIVEAHLAKDLEIIGSYAFNGCTRLSDLEVDADIEVTNIGERAFYNTMLSSTESNKLSFPNLVSIGASAFKSVKTNFSYFALPKSIKSIGESAFAECTSLSKFVMAEEAQIETMGEGVFEGCTQLTSVTLPTDIKEIPAKTFMGCYRLLYNNDFVIGKSVETIGDGAFAIYTGRGTNVNVTTYSRHVLKVDEENENFVITRLEDNRRDGNTTSTYQQGLLTDAGGLTVYAYYGSYDSTSTNSMGRTFRFLDVEGNFLTSITTIKAYAFAGVDFEYIQLPTTMKEVGDYIFYGSKIVACYISAVPWELTKYSFSKATDGKPEIEVLLLKNIAGMEEFMLTLGEYDIEARTYSGTLQ
ncbi:MAG: leucine-rich repeat domain-containing protein [Clostridia bacterium]|nr:leucine-rich repeat domain-containing protein [Clostridia bacterium]